MDHCRLIFVLCSIKVQVKCVITTPCPSMPLPSILRPRPPSQFALSVGRLHPHAAELSSISLSRRRRRRSVCMSGSLGIWCLNTTTSDLQYTPTSSNAAWPLKYTVSESITNLFPRAGEMGEKVARRGSAEARPTRDLERAGELRSH